MSRKQGEGDNASPSSRDEDSPPPSQPPPPPVPRPRQSLITTTQPQPSTSTSQPSTGKPSAGKASAGKPSARKPRTTKKRTTKSSTSKPSTTKPSTTKPSTTKPSTTKPSTTKPSTTKPSTTKPSTTKPSTTEPSTSKPSASKPSTPKPSTTKPSTTEPSTTKPSTTKRSTTKLSTTKPSTTKPSTTEPSTSKPSASKPSTPKPSTTEPSTSKPSASKPSATRSQPLTIRIHPEMGELAPYSTCYPISRGPFLPRLCRLQSGTFGVQPPIGAKSIEPQPSTSTQEHGAIPKASRRSLPSQPKKDSSSDSSDLQERRTLLKQKKLLEIAERNQNKLRNLEMSATQIVNIRSDTDLKKARLEKSGAFVTSVGGPQDAPQPSTSRGTGYNVPPHRVSQREAVRLEEVREVLSRMGLGEHLNQWNMIPEEEEWAVPQVGPNDAAAYVLFRPNLPVPHPPVGIPVHRFDAFDELRRLVRLHAEEFQRDRPPRHQRVEVQLPLFPEFEVGEGAVGPRSGAGDFLGIHDEPDAVAQRPNIGQGDEAEEPPAPLPFDVDDDHVHQLVIGPDLRIIRPVSSDEDSDISSNDTLEDIFSDTSSYSPDEMFPPQRQPAEEEEMFATPYSSNVDLIPVKGPKEEHRPEMQPVAGLGDGNNFFLLDESDRNVWMNQPNREQEDWGGRSLMAPSTSIDDRRPDFGETNEPQAAALQSLQSLQDERPRVVYEEDTFYQLSRRSAEHLYEVKPYTPAEEKKKKKRKLKTKKKRSDEDREKGKVDMNQPSTSAQKEDSVSTSTKESDDESDWSIKTLFRMKRPDR